MPSLNLDPKKSGKAQWKSLEELAGAPELKEFVDFEFPEGADTMGADVSRRRFLQVMGAGMAFAGITGCKGIRRPEMHILPYTKMPESLVPGVPQFYATTLSIGGDAIGLLVEAHEGRPTKIEGNPSHPASLGSTSRQHQASILDLYNPERSQTPLKNGKASTWEAFWSEANPLFESLKQKGGEGLCFLAGYTTSPSFRAVRDHVASVFPKAKWFVYEPVSRDNVLQGTHALTGQALEPMIPALGEIIVPTMVQLELAKWLTREAGEDKADQVVAFTQMCHVAPLDTKIALSAAEICSKHKLATSDAIVYATASEHGADLLTCDAHFDGLPGVTFVAKTGA